MNHPYRCPNCKTNRSRFNLIQQVPHPVKKDPQTGEIIDEYTIEHIEPYHMLYNGPQYRIQCAICGLIEYEQTFIKYAQIKEKI